MIYAALAVLWGAACAWWAWGYPRAAHRMARESFVETLQGELASARSDAEKVAVTNELLAEVEHGLRARAGTPKLAGWLAVAGVALLALSGYLREPDPVLGAAALGVVLGVGGAFGARRAGDREARIARERADMTASTVVGALYDAEVAVPKRARRRFRRGA